MKNQITISTLALLMSFSASAVSVYFDKDRSDDFACTIAKSIKKAYPDKSRRKLKKGIFKILREEINPWVDAYPIPAGISFPKYLERITGLPGFPMDRSEYYLQNAFILYGNPKLELKEPTKNYFASFIHLARKRHVDYLNKEAPRFKLRNEPDLLQQIEENLPNVENNAYPIHDENGNLIQQKGEFKKEKHRYKLAIGETDHKKYNEFVEVSQKHNHFSSPLFMWLLQQEDFSITPERLFEKAVEIYEDPIVALGVIPWVFSGDALTVHRGTSSVVSYKMERIVEGGDIPGYQYHFWGYLTQGIIGGRLRVGLLAYIYEKLYQKDIADWKTDVLSLKLGKQIRKNLRKPKNCEQK
tara:strand:- start:157792 stop:158859 length:1068 start_codon:yes stop_codon:yes gene_type:complete